MRGPTPLYFPVPRQGLVANVPPHQAPPDSLVPGSYNLYLDLDGLLKARNGYTPAPVNGAGLINHDYPIGMISFHNAADFLYYIVIQGINSWQYFNGTLWTDITNPNAPTTGSFDVQAQFAVLFQNGQSTVYGTNYVNQIRSWHPGQATYQTVPSAPSQALDIDVIANRLVVANIVENATNYPYRVRWSAINDGTTWPIDANVDLSGPSHELDFIVAVKALNRLNGAIYRESSIWVMTAVPGVDATAFHFELAPNAIGISGPCNPACIVPFGGIHYYLGRDARVWTFDGITAQPISDRIDAVLQSTIQNQWQGRFSAAYLPSKRQIWFFFVPNVPIAAPYFK